MEIILRKNSYRCKMSEREFFWLFTRAWLRPFSPSGPTNSWLKRGIVAIGGYSYGGFGPAEELCKF